MRFRALDQAIEDKETQREMFDKKRANVPSASTRERFKPGMIVSVCQPTPTLKKLTYQWSPPNHIIVEVHPATCTVRSLVKHGGGHDIEGCKGRFAAIEGHQSKDDEIL